MRQPALLRSLLPVFLIAPVLLLAACKSDQEKVVDFMAQGEEYVEEGKDKEAVIEYRNVLKIEPNNAVAHFALAKAYLRLGSLKDGYWELRESVRLRLRQTHKFRRRGHTHLFYDRARADESHEDLEQLLG